ncbi:hypothetical protein [Borrelia parkeri]|nr:hypothetical protein [Borrelia parkeri]
MEFLKSSLFIKLKKKYKKYGVDISDLIKPKGLDIDFKGFKNKYSTSK